MNIARDVKFSQRTIRDTERVKKRNWLNLLEDDSKEPDEEHNQEDKMEPQEEDFVEVEDEESVIEIEEMKQTEEEDTDSGDVRRSCRKRKQPNRYSDYATLTYQEALKGSDKQKWKKAINEEKDSLEENNTWEVLDIDKSNVNKPLHTKWLFKMKPDKARLVVRGCEQRQNIDYIET